MEAVQKQLEQLQQTIAAMQNTEAGKPNNAPKKVEKKQRVMFGSPTKNFKRASLRKLVRDGKIKESKDYLRGYFAKLIKPVAYMMWIPESKQFELITLSLL